MGQSAEQIKSSIMFFLKANGPTLPVRLAGEAKTTILFVSAFLSELVEDKQIKMTSMRVGSSPVYFLSGQEAMLERFSEHLKSKEKEAFGLIKEKKFLQDTAQQPAIRVALRELKDFAIPFKAGEKVIWRYYLANESDFNSEASMIKEVPRDIEIKKEMMIESRTEIKKELVKELAPQLGEDTVEKEAIKSILEKPKKSKEKKKVTRRIKPEQKDKFLEKVKEFLAGKSMELKDIESFTKNEIILRVSENGGEKILVAYNKRKITDNDMIKAYRKASELGLPYIIVGTNEPAKKTSELIKAMRDLTSIHGLK